MKKILLSVGVIGAFIIYAFYQNNSSSIHNDNTNGSSPTQDNSTPTVVSQNPPTGTTSKQYKDGEYTGNLTDAYYGNIQVKAVIKNGKIVDILFLAFPNDRSTSIEINNQAMPQLKNEAIISQSANVDIVSGATQTSEAFSQSLQSALNKAQS